MLDTQIELTKIIKDNNNNKTGLIKKHFNK